MERGTDCLIGGAGDCLDGLDDRRNSLDSLDRGSRDSLNGLSGDCGDTTADESGTSDDFSLVDENVPLLSDLGLGIMNDLSEISYWLLLHGDVLGALHNALHWNRFNGGFGNHLRNVLLNVLDGVVVDLGDFARHCLRPPALLILRNHSLLGNRFDPFTSFVVNDLLLKWHILDPRLT